MNLLLQSAKIISPGSGFHNKIVDIYIKQGIIQEIGRNLDIKGNVKIISYEKLHVSPGWFDCSVSFGEPGFEERETLANGLFTAAKSGFTQVVLNPNTSPVIDTRADIVYLKSNSEDQAVRILPMGALTTGSKGERLAELFDMQSAGAVAFGDYQKPLINANLLKIALQYTQSFNGLVSTFPLEVNIAGRGIVNEEKSATSLGLKGMPALSEELQVARDLQILEYTGGKMHIPTISTKKSVALIRAAKRKGLDISCSVALHNLWFTDEALKNFDTRFKVLPPLRTQKDANALLKGVEDGTIDYVTSDHNPIDIEHKKVEFDHALYGSIGLESMFGVLQQLFGLDKSISLLTSGIDRFLGTNPKIETGQKANLTLFNPDSEYRFSEADILSKSKNAIFNGENLKGKTYGIVHDKKIVLS